MESVHIVTANIGRGVSPAVAKRNIIKVRRAFHSDPVVGWQEIDEADGPNEHQMLHNVFGADYHHARFERKEPISIPLDFFKPGRTYVDKIMSGVPVHARGKASPDRFVVRAHVRPKGCKQVICLMNFHLANFETDDPRWLGSVERVRQLVAEEAYMGYTTVWTADTNSNRPSKMPKLHHTERRVVATDNDFIGIIPGRVRATVHGTGTINLTIDGHNAHWARMSFKDR